jgi:hypothetical protein
MFLLGITPAGETALISVLLGLLCIAALAAWSMTGDSDKESKD